MTTPDPVGLAAVALASLVIAPTPALGPSRCVGPTDPRSPTPGDPDRRAPGVHPYRHDPLLTAWHAALVERRPSEAAEDPYWLYALSNGGSFLALLVYPFVVEPLLGLTVQRAAWTAGFAALCLGVAAGAVVLSRASGSIRSCSSPG